MALALLLAGGLTALLTAAPKPSAVPPPGVWQLDLELHGAPQQISMILPGETQPSRFWYLLYTITNPSGQDIDFYPQFDLYTNTFKLYPAQLHNRPVFQEIRRLYARTIPLLEPQHLVTSRILQGADNARDSVAIFPDFDPNATSVRLFVAGLSNEVVRLELPVSTAPEAEQPETVLLRKTLALHYQVPGDPVNLADRVMLYRDREWVMR
jgi:hypothetical protein